MIAGMLQLDTHIPDSVKMCHVIEMTQIINKDGTMVLMSAKANMKLYKGLVIIKKQLYMPRK